LARESRNATPPPRTAVVRGGVRSWGMSTKSALLPDPECAVATLRAFFVEREITRFARDEPDSFGFFAELEGGRFLVHAEVEKCGSRLRLISVVAGDQPPPASVCFDLANAVNRLVAMTQVFFDTGAGRFHLETSLPLGRGRCLRDQVIAFAELHMTILGQFGPFLHRVLQGEITGSEITERMELLRALVEPEADTAKLPCTGRN
jgi:hypothetical protein